MEKTLVVLTITLMILVGFTGCLEDTPRPPAYDTPKFVLGYSEQIERPNETVIFIHGIEDVMYNRMILKIENETVMNKTNSFSIEYNTNLTNFQLFADVYKENTRFNFNATVEVLGNSEYLFNLRYIDGSEENIRERNLPFVRRFNRMEDNT